MNNSFFGGIRQQIVGLFVVLFSVLTAASYALFEVYLFEDFQQVEIGRGQKNAMRIEKLVGYMADRFRRSVVADWAQYDKAYEFVTGVSNEFIERDLTWESTVLNNFAHFVVTDSKGTPLSAGRFSSEKKDVEPLTNAASATMLGQAKIQDFIAAPSSEGLAGLIDIEGAPFFLAIAPVMRTNREGAPGGFLIFTKPADKKTLGDLTELSQLNVSFSGPPNSRPVSGSSKYDSLQFDRGNLIGSIDILDLNQEPILRAHFSYPHDILAKGYKTKSAMLWAIVSFLIIGSLALWLAIDYLLLRPLNAMAKELSTVTPSELSAHRLDESRSDELGVLARVFNGLMNSLAASYDELRKAKDFAESANSAKSSFIAKVSHELRTPIHSITGMLRILLKEERASAKRNYIMMARNAAYGLLETINEILDFSKAEAGKLALERIEFSLHAAVREAVQTVGPRIEEKGSLEAIVEMPQGLPDKIYGDPLRLRQVLVNLLGNATKFTKEGHVGLSVVIFEQSLERILLQFTVFDTGVGIPADRLDHIFEPFGQADESVSRMFTGTGLGLTIVKQFVQGMGGTVRVESEVGVGSRFILTVPFDRVEGATPVVSKPILSSPRVTLLDGGSVVVQRFAQELRANGYAPQITNCGKAVQLEALSQSVQECGLVIVTSEALKRSQVFDLMVEISNHKVIPIVAVLSPFEISVRERLLALKVPFVVTRPCSLLDILGTVSGALPFVRESWEDAEDWSLGTTRPLEVLVADDAPTNRIILTELLRDAGHHVVCVENGLELVAQVEGSLKGIPGTPSFDIILTDVQMPILDGLNATSQIRSIERELGVTTPLPIVAVTAHAMTDETSRMRNFGIDDVVTKPLDPVKLGDVIQRLTGQHSEAMPKQRTTMAAVHKLATAPLTEIGLSVWKQLTKRDASDLAIFGLSVDKAGPEDFPTVLDLADVLERTGDSVRRALLIFRGFIECYREQLQRINEAKRCKNSEELRFAAHALKGLLLDIGAQTSSKLASTIEQMCKGSEAEQARSLVGQLTKQVLLISRIVSQIEQIASASMNIQKEEPVDPQSDISDLL